MFKKALLLFFLSCGLLVGSFSHAFTTNTITIDGNFDDWSEIITNTNNTTTGSNQIKTISWTYDEKKVAWYLDLKQANYNRQAIIIYIDANNDLVWDQADYILKFTWKNNATTAIGLLYQYLPQGQANNDLPNGTYGNLISSFDYNFIQPITTKLELDLSWSDLNLTPANFINFVIAYTPASAIPDTITDYIISPTQTIQPQGRFQPNLTVTNNDLILTLNNPSAFNLPASNLTWFSSEPKLQPTLNLLNTGIPALAPAQSYDLPLSALNLLTNQIEAQALALTWTYPPGPNIKNFNIDIATIPSISPALMLTLFGLGILLLLYQATPNTMTLVKAEWAQRQKQWLYVPTFTIVFTLFYLFIRESYFLEWLTSQQTWISYHLLQPMITNLQTATPNLLILNVHNIPTIVAITNNCSALLETLLFLGIILAYPNFSRYYRSKAIVLGTIAIQILNLLRIILVILMLNHSGINAYYQAHTLLGNGLFYIGLLGIFIWFITRKTDKTIIIEK